MALSVKTFPVHTPDIRSLGILNPGRIDRNLPVPVLVERAVARGEGILSPTGALACITGKYTGRSPRDKFIVDEPEVHDRVAWGKINQPFPEDRFDRLYDRLMAYLEGRDLFVFDGFVGADPRYRVPVRIINEFAWHNLFVHQLFIRPTAEELVEHQPEFTVVCAPGFLADPEADGTRSEAFIVVSFTHRVAIIGGTRYAGEMKKSIFGILNYLLPLQGVLPMHCSANMGADGTVALYFGLSGTGKTTLSSDPTRHIIGDDEHGWTDTGIFNFEGGCYAKTIHLRPEGEPLIWNAIRFGAVLENVVLDPDSRVVDWDDPRLTENARAAYPIEFIPGAVVPSVGGHPRVIFFLTADAQGVLPPISRLTREQAMYHFLSGYTSKLAGTERGVSGTESTFSTLFGAPFFPLPPVTYARMLGEKLDRHGTQVYLVNTGWTGGPQGVGRRIDLAYTRAMVNAAIDGRLDGVRLTPHPVFQVHVPDRCPGVPDGVLDPRGTWSDKAAYDAAARELAAAFRANFERIEGVPAEIAAAGPRG
jgi:phosphoenolpyruvate carboxykinase (ATP)